MGGATDATNLITRPLVSLLTSVSMDHMQFLGNTLREIAQVKAGIIKKGCPVVTVAQKPEVMEGDPADGRGKNRRGLLWRNFPRQRMLSTRRREVLFL